MKDGSNRTLCFLLLALVVTSPVAWAKESFPYLYATKDDPDASAPVVDHIAPTGRKEVLHQKPGFLYRDLDHYRIVNFCK